MSQPPHPVGYVVYKINEPGLNPIFLTEVTHLAQVRDACAERVLLPTEVIIYRKFSNDTLKPMFIHEFAYRTQSIENIGGLTTQTLVWSWEPEQLEHANTSAYYDEYNGNVGVTYEVKLSFWSRLKYRLLNFFSFKNQN